MTGKPYFTPAFFALIATLITVAVSVAAPPQKRVTSGSGPDFNREARPILANRCFKCHGPDDKQRAAGLRLDTATGAYARLASGRRAIDAAHPDKSEILERIATHAGAAQMPPVSANKPLSDAERRILVAWAAAGGRYEPHWAFVAPKQVAALPTVRRKGWTRNPIDFFVLARLEKANLTPEAEADRCTLIRRVSLDLTGIPPTPEEADAFVRDARPDAYERLVDRLLASPHYGERWARPWLDLARYADTNGYEKDRPRSMWPYRDWVIRALNADMPFDRFTIAQIAGDMLPNATLDDRIATGFHRNTMLNEEGGADPLEYRFHAMTDRVATTGSTWLGLTVGCAQCHTHKFDPIPHREYYRLMAFLDNADEIPMLVPKPDIAQKRSEMEREIAQREAALPTRFPLPGAMVWESPTSTHPMAVTIAAGGAAESLPDGSIRIGGANPETNVYTVTLTAPPGDVSAVRLETLTDPTLGAKGPGRTPHGNFVLTEITATVTLPDAAAKPQPVKFARAEADVQQEGFPAMNAIDGKSDTGWAIQGPGNWNADHALTLTLEKPIALPAGAKWTFRIEQNYGGQHTIGRFRLSVGRVQSDNDPRPEAERRRERFDAAFAAWKKENAAKAVRWTILQPLRAHADVPVLRILPDNSVLSTSDITKRDVYEVAFSPVPAGATALRLEAIPDERLPGGGPGRVYYEGEAGDFFLNELTATIGGSALKWKGGVASIGNAAAATDGDPLSGWSVSGGQGKTQTAIFPFDKPLPVGGALATKMVFERYYASSLGRFRVSYSTDSRAGQAALNPEVEDALTTPEAARTEAQKSRLVRAFVATAPELAGERAAIEKLRRSMPAYPTTLVFQERPAENPRATYIRHRGEFLQPEAKVMPGALSVLNPLPKDAPANRLTFARWLVSPENPLTARVVVNRQWAALFGAGIVRTLSDFGYQGEPPTHPELLDYLAAEFVQQGWSLKKLHRLIVTSATYRQASRVTPDKLAHDPENRLLSRGPRVRLDAELVRDAALAESGLLSPKMYGPSVFPPQPPGITTDGAYGPLEWKISEGEDRYRRGLYTFAKRTAPYAMFNTFDAPSGEATCPRRELSNTPLQALTLLNDAVFVEAAQALGSRVAAHPGSPEEKAAFLFRRVVTRPPEKSEVAALTRFYATQKARLETHELDPKTLAAPAPGDPTDRAAWTLLARAVLNLDEAFVKR